MQKRTKIIIHIGDAKTGTTSLQKLLNAHNHELQARNIFYARAGREVEHAIAHHALPISMWAQTSKINLMSLPSWAALRLEIDDMPDGATMILSSEGFSSMSEEWPARAMAEFFATENVQILLTLRDQIEWVESMYTQNVKASPFALAPFEQFQRGVVPKGITAAMQLVTSFTPEAFKILFYNENIILQLLDFIGISDLFSSDADAGTPQNTRDPDALIEAFFALNKIEMPAHVRDGLYSTIQKTCSEHGFKYRDPIGTAKSRFVFTADQRRAFILQHNALINRFCTTFDVHRDRIVKG
jgi:hypothetical protein